MFNYNTASQLTNIELGTSTYGTYTSSKMSYEFDAEDYLSKIVYGRG